LFFLEKSTLRGHLKRITTSCFSVPGGEQENTTRPHCPGQPKRTRLLSAVLSLNRSRRSLSAVAPIVLRFLIQNQALPADNFFKYGLLFILARQPTPRERAPVFGPDFGFGGAYRGQTGCIG